MNSCVFTSVSTSIFSAPILMKSSKSSSISEDDSDLLLKNKSEKEKLSSLLRKQGNVLSLENFFRQLPFRQLMKWHETSFQAPDRKIKCLFTFHFINVISLVLFFFFFPVQLLFRLLACLCVCLFEVLFCKFAFIPQTIDSFNSSFFCLSISLPTSYSMSMGMCEYQTQGLLVTSQKRNPMPVCKSNCLVQYDWIMNQICFFHFVGQCFTSLLMNSNNFEEVAHLSVISCELKLSSDKESPWSLRMFTGLYLLRYVQKSFPFQLSLVIFQIQDLAGCCFSKLFMHSYRGTHGYMAPEVLKKGEAYDSSADWFSLGCMLFKLLVGYV